MDRDAYLTQGFTELFQNGSGDTCSRCAQPIQGEVENLTCIADQPGTTAHFFCYYPQGVADRSIPMPRWAMLRLAVLSPERARFFSAEALRDGE